MVWKSKKKRVISKKMNKDILKFITCGSVDDGKSTLVGRLLYDANLLTKDQIESLVKDSKNSSNKDCKENLDFSLLTDGLQAEKEQGITIDVSYRFFETEERKFIIADCPGHVEYTRNMATASSNTNLALILIDAKNGVTEQTKRHFLITHLFGIKDFVIVVNKMDLINFEEEKFLQIKQDFINFSQDILRSHKSNLIFLPVSAVNGDNVVDKSLKMPWYDGDSLFEILKNIKPNSNIHNEDFIIGIKYVARPNSDFRGFKGKISSGKISISDKVRVFGKRVSSSVKEIFIDDKKVDSAKDGDIVCLTLKDEIDISSGDFLTDFSSSLTSSSKFNADLIWLDHKKLNLRKEYLIKFYNNEALTVRFDPKFKYNISNLKEENFDDLKFNQIGNLDFEINANIALSSYEINKELGSFILIDKITNFTAAAGVIKKSNISSQIIPTSQNIFHSKIDIKTADRAKIKNQKPLCIWLTGLSGSGKSTIANLLDEALYKTGKHSFILDGDNIRHGLNSDLGFSREDRSENIRRIGYACKLMSDAGLIIISAFISPDAKMRDFVRNNIFKNEGFIEIYLDTDIEVCKKRDPKNLYKKALAGEIKDFTGLDAPYDIPDNPEIVIDTVSNSAEKCVEQILKMVSNREVVNN
ncbi:MAG: bifunctional enzyme CysN/CysC [Rickettsiales bacterium]|jgi:bifunctional enzyme CysN/CysC